MRAENDFLEPVSTTHKPRSACITVTIGRLSQILAALFRVLSTTRKNEGRAVLYSSNPAADRPVAERIKGRGRGLHWSARSLRVASSEPRAVGQAAKANEAAAVALPVPIETRGSWEGLGCARH